MYELKNLRSYNFFLNQFQSILKLYNFSYCFKYLRCKAFNFFSHYNTCINAFKVLNFFFNHFSPNNALKIHVHKYLSWFK
jgi:hypothetical protein